MQKTTSSSTVRRLAWIHSSRHRSTVEDPDRRLSGPPPPSTLDDNVFSDGCLPGKIENWLLGCGSDGGEEESRRFASKLNGEQFISERGIHRPLGGHPSSLRLDHSIASNHFSSTCKSSVTEVLEFYSEDAEETLSDLGFGWQEPQVAVRIPPRFLTFPSHAKGINFRLFLDSQLRRIREEDPSLSLASRFRQVQVLTEMANAFYSLYSHVSRTPLQKLALPKFSFNSSTMESIERFRSSAHHETRSPVERLKDTVNKMCLYTSPRGSDSTSPQPSPRKECTSPEVGDFILERRPEAEKKLNLGEPRCWRNSAFSLKMMQDSSLAAHKVRSENSVKPTNLDKRIQCIRLPCSDSEKNVIKTDHHFPSCQIELDSHTNVYHRRSAEPLGENGLFCSQRADTIHQASLCPQKTHSLSWISSKADKDAACPESCKLCMQTLISQLEGTEMWAETGPSGKASLVKALGLTSDRMYNSSDPFCSITVSGCEGDYLDATNSHHAAPQTCEEAHFDIETQNLLPLPRHGDRGHASKNMQQLHSFEMEEVQSAGEEDFGQSETSRGAASSLLMKSPVVRGDSLQSDSSGYAEEEICPSPEQQ